MLGRRSALLGLLGMGGLTAPLAMRPTSQQPTTSLAIGLSGGPQILIDTTLNYTVVILSPVSGTTPSNVSSVANITAAVRFPSNNPAEASPPLIAETLITFTDGSIADALLTLSGFAGLGDGSFTLSTSARSLVGGGGNSSATMIGGYTFSGTTITLKPSLEIGDATGIVSWAGIRQADPTVTTLLNFGDPFHNLGSTGLVGDAGTSQFKLTAENELQLSVHSSFNALGAITTATFANVLPAGYIPVAARLTGGVPISVNGAAPGPGTRLTITGGTGAVNLANLPAGATAAGCDVRIPLT